MAPNKIKIENLKLSDMDKETSARIVAAREAGKQYMENEPLAEKAYYDRDLKRIVIHLNNDFMLCISPSKIQGLEGASEKDLDDIEILPPGIGVRWDRLDVDMSVAGLASSIYGSRAWMKELARRGGKSQSPAKVAAAKANGKKGGRPRKVKSVSHETTLIIASIDHGYTTHYRGLERSVHVDIERDFVKQGNEPYANWLEYVEEHLILSEYKHLPSFPLSLTSKLCPLVEAREQHYQKYRVILSATKVGNLKEQNNVEFAVAA